jgi:hypothetical protein
MGDSASFNSRAVDTSTMSTGMETQSYFIRAVQASHSFRRYSILANWARWILRAITILAIVTKQANS